jgi:4-amino-4-deoxy-L-arabinose transferase-like glycosyltransferase
MDGLSCPAPADPSRRWRVSLVLPACNEEASIRRAVAEADEALAALAEDYEILVVDDGSRDATAAAVADEAARRPHVRLLRHGTNRGYGAALRTGFRAARCDFVAFTDADCQFHAADLARLLPLTDDHPIAVGYREERQDPWQRRFLSGGYNLLTRLLLGTRVRDVDCALKVFRREALPELLPRTRGFFVNAEMLTRARQHGLRVAEAGVRHRPRLCGASKVSLAEVPRTLATLLPFWWSRVLFAGRMCNPSSRRTDCTSVLRTPLGTLALLAVLAGLLFLTRLRAPLLEPQEPRCAEVPRQMLHEGNWLVPVLHGQAHLDLPPLFYWLVMASYRLFGVHDWAARLVPGLAGVLTVLLTYLWGRRAAGPRAGLAGALVLCLSAEFVYRARMLTMDGLVCLWVTAALAAAHAALAGGTLRRGWWLASAAACGLGVLTRGPVALVLVAVPVLAYRCLDPRAARVRLRGGLLYLAVAAAVAGPWYAAVLLPDIRISLFWQLGLPRLPGLGASEKGKWLALPQLLAGMMPWTLLLPGAVRFLARRSRRAARRRPAVLGFFVLSALGCLVFFAASGCTQACCLLPALPPLALVLGCYLDVLLPQRKKVSFAGASGLWRPEWAALWRRGSRPAFRATLAVLALGLGLAGLATTRQVVRPGSGVLLAGAAAVGMVLVWRRRAVSWGACALTTFAVLFLAVVQLYHGYNRQFALRSQLRAAVGVPRTPGLPVVCYPQRWDSVSFYLPQADVRVYTAAQQRELLDDLRSRPRTLVLVKSAALHDLLQALPPAAEFVPRGRPGAVTAGWVKVHPEAPTHLFAAQ